MPTKLSQYEILRHEFDAEAGSFLIQLRGLYWDKKAFKRLTQAMYQVANDLKDQDAIPKWIANGFWYTEQFTKEWSSHPNFPQPDETYHEDCLEILYFLSDLLFADGAGMQEGALEIWIDEIE